MKPFVCILQLLLLCSLPGKAETATDREKWFDERKDWIAAAEAQKTPEHLQNLSRIILRIGRDLDQAPPKAIELYRAAQRAALSIPGHADFLKNRVVEAQAARKAAVGTYDSGPAQADLSNIRSEAFGTLARLPDPGSVRVLGEFLTDESGPEFIVQDERRDLTMSWFAVAALSQLPLLDMPTTFGVQYDERSVSMAIPSWRLWYEQIKSGNRTFRFKGDPTEYDLDGPASPQKLERIAKNRQRDEKREAGKNGREPAATTARSADCSLGKGSIAAAVFVLTALATAGWWLIRKSRKVSACR